MFRSIFLKSLYNLRWQALAWSLGIGFLAFVTMAFYNSFDQAGISDIINSVPDTLKSLVGSIDDYKTIPGYIGQQIFGPNVVIFTIVMAVILSLGISANEEDNGRLQSLLSLPVTRTSVFFQKWLAIVLIIAVVCACVVIGVLLALPIVDKTADIGRVLQSVFACWLMNTAYATVGYAAAMLTGKKGLTIAITTGYAAASFTVSTLAAAIDKLQPIDKLSIFHYYNNPQIMQHGLDMQHIGILSAVTVVLLCIGWLGFTRRNVGV